MSLSSSGVTLTSASMVSSKIDSLIFHYKDPKDYILPTNIIQDGLPISRSLI